MWLSVVLRLHKAITAPWSHSRTSRWHSRISTRMGYLLPSREASSQERYAHSQQYLVATTSAKLLICVSGVSR